MSTFIRTITAILAIGLLPFFATSCSKQSRAASTLEQANRYYAAGQYDQAEIEYKNLLKLDAQNGQAVGRLGMIYFEQGRVGLAYSQLNRGRALQPDNTDLRIKLGTIYVATGRLDDARKEATYVLDRKPGDDEAPMLLVNSIRLKKDVEEIRAQLLGLPGPAPEGVPVVLALGMLEFKQRNLKEAESAFRRAVALDFKSSRAWSALANLLVAQDNRIEAETAFKQAADLSPPRSSRRLEYALFKIQTGDTANGRRLLEEMMRTTPDYLPAIVTLAQVSLNEKKYSECDTLLGKALARDPALPEAILLGCQLALAQGQSDKAVTESEKAIRLYPRSSQAHHLLGVAYLGSGQTDKAAASLEQALTLSPGLSEAAMMLAGIKARKGDYNAAIISLRQVVTDHPELPQAWAILADTYRSQGNLAAALEVYVEMDKRFAPGPLTPLYRGLIHRQENRPAEARLEFARALAISPGFLSALEQLVNLDLAERQFDAAQKRVEEVLAQDSKQAGVQVLLARVFSAKNDVPRAEAALKQAIEIQPENPTTYYLLASLYYSNKEHVKALENLKALIEKNPKNLQALMLTGVLNEEIKDYTSARSAYEKLIAASPRFGAALNNLAYIYSERFNQLDKGYEAALKAREVSPGEPHIADTLGWILFKKGQYSRALSLLEESASNLPTEPEVQYHLGMSYYMAGNEDAARNTLQRALTLNETFNGVAEAKRSIEVLSMDLGRGPGARAALEKIITERPDDPMARARLALAYELEGNTAKAVSTYEEVIKASPNNTKAAVSLIRLYATRSESAKALNQAKATRKTAPADADVAHLLGNLVFQTGDYPWALSLLQEAARKKINDPETQFDLAIAHYSMGRIDDAESAMNDALQANPGFSRANSGRQFLELVALRTNPSQAAAASARIDQILKDQPSNVPALMAVAVIHELKSNSAAATQAYEKALSVYPEFTPAKRQLAILYSADQAKDKKTLELGLAAREMFADDADLARALGIAAYRLKEYSRAATWLQESASKREDVGITQFYLGMARFQLKQNAQSRQSLQNALNLNLSPELAGEARRVLSELR